MESKPKVEINTKKIQDFVQRELLSEQKYQRENDAKFRAIEQRVPTFEDFRQMVLAAHLRPLDKGETLQNNVSRNNTGKVWNSAITATGGSNETDTSLKQARENDDVSALLKSAPSNNTEFVKTWKFIESQLADQTSSCHQVKWEYLKSIGPARIQELFKAEISGDILGSFLLTFEHQLKTTSDETADDKHLIYQFLNTFPKCGRFGLNLMFLKADQTAACKSIFKLLEQEEKTIDDVVELQKKYF